eukprot:12035697-Alexandrium_andersonii.AAC.1
MLNGHPCGMLTARGRSSPARDRHTEHARPPVEAGVGPKDLNKHPRPTENQQQELTGDGVVALVPVSYTHLRAHETSAHL